MHVVIVGAGIMGATAAYYLVSTSADVRVTLLERASSPALGASGKAGGFLARDWCDDTPVEPLARRGFELHKELADRFEHDQVEYRAVHAIAVSAKQSLKAKKQKHGHVDVDGLCWLDGEAVEYDSVERIGNLESTAQVHPFKLTIKLIDAAVETGRCELWTNCVVSQLVVKDGRVLGVQIENSAMLDADKVLLAMGPWTCKAEKWINSHTSSKLNWTMDSEKYHSIVLDTCMNSKEKSDEKQKISSPQAAVFLTYASNSLKGKASKLENPEIYPRLNGKYYVCGQESFESLPEGPEFVTPNHSNCTELYEIAKSVSSRFLAENVSVRQACYLPIPKDSMSGSTLSFPIIGKVTPEIGNLYICSGSSCWGILTAPAIGERIASVILEK
jgi:glycine/D-amino acid oxidase-like deaminating enzyme